MIKPEISKKPLKIAAALCAGDVRGFGFARHEGGFPIFSMIGVFWLIPPH